MNRLRSCLLTVPLLAVGLTAGLGESDQETNAPTRPELIEAAVVGPDLQALLEGGILAFNERRVQGDVSHLDLRRHEEAVRLVLEPEIDELRAIRDRWFEFAVWPTSEEEVDRFSGRDLDALAVEFVDLPLLAQLRLLTLVQDSAAELFGDEAWAHSGERVPGARARTARMIGAVAIIRIAYPVDIGEMRYSDLMAHRAVFGALGWEHLLMDGREVDGERRTPSHDWPIEVVAEGQGGWAVAAIVRRNPMPAPFAGSFDLIRELLWRRQASDSDV